MQSVFRNHPPRRLFLEKERAEFEAALETVQQELGREYPLEAGGTEVRSGDRMTIANPSHRDGPPVAIVHAAGEADIAKALETAVDAQAAWEVRPVSERAGLLRRAADILIERQMIVAAWEVHEAAKAWAEALADVDEAIDYLHYYADSAEAVTERFADYRARGVVAVIPPWNFPAAIPCGMTAAALVTGNAVVLKPAEQTPLVARQLVQVLHEAGIPAGVVQWRPGRGEVAGAALVASPYVDIVAFTGSAAVGAAIYKQGAQISPSRGGLRATLAEMGGKNPILVFSDADVDEAVVGILGSAFGHSNQKCSAASRILIQRSIYDRVRNRLVEGAASLRAGPADQPGVVVTPLIDEEARERVLDAGKRAATEGTIALAAEPPAPDSTLLTPLLVEIPAARAKTASTTQQEIFGPVLALVPFRDEAEAIALANDTRYALTAGVFSRSPATISRVVAALDAGNVYVNRPTTGARVGVEPFGGHKLSGTGPKAGGSDYLWAFVTARAAQKTVGRPPEGSLDAPEQEMRPWSEPPENRARALASAVALLAGDLKSQWTAATTGAKKDATDATFQLLRHLLQQIPEIELPEPTIALPGQQTSINWDTPRGCGIIVADDGGSLTGLAGMLCGALLAGNGAIVCVSGRRRAAAGLLVRALLQAGVPAESLIEAEAGVRLPSIAELPNVTFAAVDAGLALTQYIYMLLADASATGEAPLLKALITSNDGPGIGEPGFLRRFALPKTVAIRTLHLGADLELPDTRE